MNSYIELDENYEVVGYFNDKEFTEEFNFDEDLSKDIVIYAKISEIQQEEIVEDEEITEEEVVEEIKPEKDDVPKTGIESYIGLAVGTIILSTIGIIYFRKKF